MSTTGDHASGASGTAVQQVPGLSGGELREGYAEVGDVKLHYVEAGEGPLVVLLHGFPEFWYGWRLQIAPLAAAGFRVVAPDLRGYNLSSRPGDVKAYGTEQLTADLRGLIADRGATSASLVGHDWGGTVAWDTAMAYPRVVDRLAILNAAHPRKLSEGLHHPGQLRKSWYFFFFDLPDLPESVVHANDWHFFRHFLRDARPAYTPQEFDRYIEAWSQPGAATGMINYYRFSVRESPKKAEAALRPIAAPTLVIWDERATTWAPSSPSPATTTSPTCTASNACPTPPTGSTTTKPTASTSSSPTSSRPPSKTRAADCHSSGPAAGRATSPRAGDSGHHGIEPVPD